MEELKTLPEYLKASNADGTAILEATTTWCSQCKAIAPFVERLMKKYPDARFYNYDTDSALDISQELAANQMPTFHIFKDGDLKDSITGAKAKELEKAISSNYDGKVDEGGE
ncbi:related to thioredoxin Trx1 [Lecanosticta acicola]|uniref:Related to thioredoxin Trx1 n=1 Tax=Lecanosticta acicola TaxID=111012 RepID=A0AAI8YUG0_9PEZI|nr:related to thioredoxin Trx1 [Lecanosticta acicola]